VFNRHRIVIKKRWIVIAAPVAAATALSLAPLAASQAATPPASAPAAPAALARPAAALPVMTFKMNGKTVSIGGSLKSGAERIVFTVTGEATGSPGLVRLDPGVTIGQFFAHFAAAAQDPNNLYGVGQIAMNTDANKGTSSVLINFVPGTYVALDLGAPAKTPPLSVFKITRAKHPAALPKPGATIASREFGFTGATVVKKGETVRWLNNGFLVHMIVGAEAPNQATAIKIAALLKAGKDNQAQALAIGFYGFDDALSHGESFQSVINQHPGFWVIACFMATQDGREHTTLGMEKVIQILP
jgi:plastocyanin